MISGAIFALARIFWLCGRPDAVNILQRDPGLFIDRYINSRDTWHLFPPYTLPLFMLGVIADNPDDPAPFDDFAFFTSDFY